MGAFRFKDVPFASSWCCQEFAKGYKGKKKNDPTPVSSRRTPVTPRAASSATQADNTPSGDSSGDVLFERHRSSKSTFPSRPVARRSLDR